ETVVLPTPPLSAPTRTTAGFAMPSPFGDQSGAVLPRRWSETRQSKTDSRDLRHGGANISPELRPVSCGAADPIVPAAELDRCRGACPAARPAETVSALRCPGRVRRTGPPAPARPRRPAGRAVPDRDRRPSAPAPAPGFRSMDGWRTGRQILGADCRRTF